MASCYKIIAIHNVVLIPSEGLAKQGRCIPIIPTYLYLHTNLGLRNCHFRSRKGAEPEQGRFNQSCEQGCPSSRGAGPEQARTDRERWLRHESRNPFLGPWEAFFGH
jgi:hypothetical protein